MNIEFNQNIGVNAKILYALTETRLIPFAIDSYTGEIMLSHKLDRETTDAYKIQV